MRRQDREVKEIGKIKEIIEQCKTCHLAMADGNMPYVIPLSFGFEIIENTLTLYFHCAKEGRKIDILTRNNQICFEMCCEGEPIFARQTPCNSGYYYSSVHGFGQVSFVEDIGEKCHALTLLMRQQTGEEIVFTEKQAESVCVFKVSTEEFTGKRKPHPQYNPGKQ